ncbi:insulinase family protein [Streptomyces sp. PTM05]|uniref:Insulinase family protein n=1 Tax=Streptantibioticus parmotrematis TaxID=2873249 RepID=A0ABS7QKL3_9ACTN|nr:insulinase family protein [Streptantibioticus parmotrematis]MBY8883675.1 insulinase family protein [Streptantibioticus parmotrematis]
MLPPVPVPVSVPGSVAVRPGGFRGSAPAGGLHRARLGNGLRILVAADHSAPVVSVAVVYDVGNRSEPEGREGFAHLFEHMMFQGSENVPKLAHAKLVNAAGGSFNGVTWPDHTSYYQVLPSGGLELALYLEADRMRAPRLTEENLANQVAVVGQEIRRKVVDNPYGGLPHPHLQAVMFDDFANAHDGWGAADRLATVTVAECEAFFAEYYSPANALLVVCGDATPALVEDLAERHFGAIPASPAPPTVRGCGPRLPEDRHRDHPHPAAVLRAMAAGWRLPDPAPRDGAYPAALLLAEVLANGTDSVLQERLVHRDAVAQQLSMRTGLGGAPFECRDPDVLSLVMFLHPGADPRSALDAGYEELAHLAHRGPAPESLARRAATWATSWLRALDPLGLRVQRLGAFELLHGDAELVWDLPVRIRAIGPAEVADAAAALAAQPRRWVTVTPGAAEPATGAGRAGRLDREGVGA